jgi:hypothetical protein
MKTVYKYKGKEINIDNYEEVISKKIAYIFIRLIIYINVLIFGRTIFKIISSILLIYDIISFIMLFIIYYNLYKFKNTKIPQENMNLLGETTGRLIGEIKRVTDTKIKNGEWTEDDAIKYILTYKKEG